jgi:hypothetical protein
MFFRALSQCCADLLQVRGFLLSMGKELSRFIGAATPAATPQAKLICRGERRSPFCRAEWHSAEAERRSALQQPSEEGCRERVKKFENEQNHLAQRRKDAEAEKKIKELLVPNLSVSARDCVIFHTFRIPFPTDLSLLRYGTLHLAPALAKF